MKALGLIEVYGKLAAVEALDSALKAANVELVDVTRVGGGLVTVMIAGDVGATKAAMDAAEASAQRVGRVISVHVIPRPSEDVGHMVARKESVVKKTKEEPVLEESLVEECDDKLLDESLPTEIEEEIQPIEESADVEADEIELQPVQKETITKESLQSMTVANLRSLARQLEITNMTRKEIRFANKEDLVRSISEFLEQE